jgi:two-component system, OmpR family, sensor histidine kinase MtrB
VVVIDARGGYLEAEVDPRRLRRILRNLLGNAIEHGEGRPIVVAVDSNETAIALSVRDYGLGMTEEEAERVFDRFWRADPARARTTGGSGLGLSIATEDTKLHNGWLQAWGNTGVGSSFRLTLPLKQGGTITKSPLPLEPADVALGSPGDHSVLVLGPGAAAVPKDSAAGDPAAVDSAAVDSAAVDSAVVDPAPASGPESGAAPAREAEPAAAARAGTPEAARTGKRS